MKNFRGAALAAGVGTPESVPHESEQDSFDFKHRNSRTIGKGGKAVGMKAAEKKASRQQKSVKATENVKAAEMKAGTNTKYRPRP